MPMYSHSRLSVYETCPRQFRFQYVDKVAVPEVESVEMFLGSRVHAALQDLYDRVRQGTVPALDDVLAGFRRDWVKEWTPDIQISREDMTAEDYLALGGSQLTTYDERYRPFDQERTVAVERRVSFPLDETRKIWMQGYVDRLSVTREGLWQIHDYKTGRWLPSQADLDRDRQLALYQIGVQRQFPRQARDVELVWHYLAHDLEMRSRREPEALRELETRTLALIDRIQADTAFPLLEGPHCARCSYQSRCPAWSHLFTQEALPEAERPLEDGAALVDRLAALRARRREVKAEIGQTEADLIAYARAAGVEAVFGTTHRARIAILRTLSLPKQGDPRRAEMEAILRAGGRWEEVAELNIRAVGKKLASGDWPADLIGALDPFQDRGETARISLRRRQDPEDS